MLKHYLFGIIASTVLLTSTGQHLEAADELIMYVGQQQLIAHKKPVVRIAIGNTKLISVRSLKKGQEVLIRGKSPGKTDLILWHKRGRKNFTVQVLANEPNELLSSLKQYLKEVEGINIQQVGRQVVIRGELLRPQDRYLVRQLAKHQNNIRDLTTMHPKAMTATMSYMREVSRLSGFDHIEFLQAGDTIFVEGMVASLNHLERLQKTISKIYADLDWRVSTTYSSGDMVLMDVKMVEVRKSSLLNLGIQWQKVTPVEINASISSQNTSGMIGLAEAIPISLNTLQQKGLLRLLSNPKLSCRYNKTCVFQAGGEIPIPLVGERSVKVEFKSYGIGISLTPNMTENEKLAIDLDIEFSDVDFATAVNGIPGLLRNRLQTRALVGFNQSIVLSGLVNQRQSKNVDRFPLLGGLPIIGEAFKNRRLEKNDSEFVLFLTPTPMNPNDPVNQHYINRSQQIFESSAKELSASFWD